MVVCLFLCGFRHHGIAIRRGVPWYQVRPIANWVRLAGHPGERRAVHCAVDMIRPGQRRLGRRPTANQAKQRNRHRASRPSRLGGYWLCPACPRRNVQPASPAGTTAGATTLTGLDGASGGGHPSARRTKRKGDLQVVAPLSLRPGRLMADVAGELARLAVPDWVRQHAAALSSCRVVPVRFRHVVWCTVVGFGHVACVFVVPWPALHARWSLTCTARLGDAARRPTVPRPTPSQGAGMVFGRTVDSHARRKTPTTLGATSTAREELAAICRTQCPLNAPTWPTRRRTREELAAIRFPPGTGWFASLIHFPTFPAYPYTHVPHPVPRSTRQRGPRADAHTPAHAHPHLAYIDGVA